jgi:hypothetical protein
MIKIRSLLKTKSIDFNLGFRIFQANSIGVRNDEKEEV